MSEKDARVSALAGDPLNLAEQQFRLAQELCGECRDYHAIQPYRRLSGMVNGIEKDADILEPMLRELVEPRGKILIAGSADASLLGMMWRATGGLDPLITVADRCPTPLAACGRYAQAHGFAIDTTRLEFGSAAFPRAYDLVFGHGILRFVPSELRVAFLKTLGGALSRGGTLVLVERPVLPGTKSPPPGEYAGEMVTALAARGIALPEDEAQFRARIDRLAQARPTRESAALGTKTLRDYLEEAGFAIRVWREHDRRRTIRARDGGAPAHFVTEIVGASPRDNDSFAARPPQIATGGMRES